MSQGSGKAVNLSDVFTCFSADVIGSYVFGTEYGFLESEDFNPGWRSLMTVGHNCKPDIERTNLQLTIREGFKSIYTSHEAVWVALYHFHPHPGMDRWNIPSLVKTTVPITMQFG